MKVLKAGTRGFYDVFVGETWKNHTRVQVKRTPHGPRIYHVSGLPLTKELLINLGKEV